MDGTIIGFKLGGVLGVASGVYGGEKTRFALLKASPVSKMMPIIRVEEVEEGADGTAPIARDD